MDGTAVNGSPAPATAGGDVRGVFPGDGEMAAHCRAVDWAGTPLGPVGHWSPTLRTAAALVVSAGFPTVLLWGPALVQIYNDGYRAIMGPRHPAGLGQPARECWPELWHVNAPVYERVLAGETVRLDDALHPVTRAGALEDAWFTVACSPVRDDAGAVDGVLVTLVEITAGMLGRAAQAECERLEGRLHGALTDAALVLDQMSDAYLVMDGEFRIVALNPSAERALGMPRAVLLGRTHWEAFPASVGAEPERQYRRVAAERVPAHFVHHYVGEGHDFHLEIDAYPARGDGVAVFWRDISERVRAAAAVEAARAEAETRAATLAAVIDSIPDAVLVGRPDAITLANHAALAQLGVPSIDALRAAAPATPTSALPLPEVLLDPATGVPVALAATPIGRALSGERSHAHFLLRAGGVGGAGGADGARHVRVAAAPIIGPDGGLLGAVAVLTDVSRLHAGAMERERLLAELGGERTLLRTVLDQMPAAVFIVEAPSGRVLAMNDAVARVWGEPRPHTDAVGRYSEEWVGYHLDGRRVASDEWPIARAALAGETVTDWIGEIERADGTRVTIEVSAVPVQDAQGRTVAAVAVAADITARAYTARERERLLRELEVERARLAYVFEQAPTFLAVTRGPSHVFELVNAAYHQLVGRRALIGRRVADALPEVREQGFVELLDQVLATGEPFVGREVPIALARTPDAPPEPRFVDFVYLPVLDADGTRSGIIAHGSDVTEQVQARREIERLLAESELARLDAEAARTRSEAVLGSIADAFYLVDHDWRFTYVNDAAGPLLQTTRELLLGRTVWEAFPDVVGSPFESPYREAMATGRVTSVEAYFAPLGTWFDVRSYPWAGGLMVHFRDIGQRKAAEAERERLLADAEAARREAEAANRAKSEFLAVMSHELRTPLNAIGGYAELMEMGIRGPVTPQQRDDLARIQKSQRHLLGLINGVLNYSRAEAGAVHYELADVPLDAVLATCETLIAPQARAKSIALQFAACREPRMARGDREKVQQIVVNLLSNAVKFTAPGGRVTLACARDERPGGEGKVVVTVTDTGRGIASDALEHIFEPFVQVDTRLTRTDEGIGLGLAISRDLARGMGGELTAESTLGVGSTFTLTLPAA